MMKVLKGIGLFFVYPAVMLFLGFWGGVEASQFFYPGSRDESAGLAQQAEAQENVSEEADPGDLDSKGRAVKETEARGHGMALGEDIGGQGDEEDSLQRDGEDELLQVSAVRETLAADTEYVLLETDILRDTEVETSWRLPSQYVGMDREQFLTAMENYGSFPPLSELERGFVNLEVVSFSRERVVVRMNYQYVQPGEGFYLAVQNHEVIVYLEDQETVYINTGIMLETLPEELQLEIMDMLYMEEEKNLYNFLETYSS